MKKNKKFIIVIALLTLLIGKSFCQIDLGIKSGINVSTQLESGVSWTYEDLISGLNAGAILRYHVNELFALKSDISYTQKGRRYRNLSEGSRNIVHDRFHYIIVPLKAEISIGKRAGLDNGQKLFFAVGPYYGFLLNAEKKDDGTNISLKETTEKYDYGLTLDLGFEFPVKNHSITFSANYEKGLSEFAEYDDDLRNNTISINLGFIF